MGEDVKHPMRGLGLSSLCLQEKKGLRPACVCVYVFVFVPDVWSSYSLTEVHCCSLSALVSAVSVAVEAILAQFSSSRTVVQKVS